VCSSDLQARWQGAIRWRCGPDQAAPDRREGAVAPARGGGRARPDLTGVKSGEKQFDRNLGLLRRDIFAARRLEI
jgi:hypothetical protein